MYNLEMSSFHDKVIIVGDTHVRKGDVAEMQKFIRWLVEIAKYNTHDRSPLILFMGDQYNDFSIVQVEVEEFWVWAYGYIKNVDIQSCSIKGNHDMNQTATDSSMSVHREQTRIAGETPVFISPTIAAIGFFRKEEDFYKTVMGAYSHGARTIFCHVEFQGSQYENGFYAPHGFDLSKYPSDLKFISGHIHLKQAFGNVTYVGTPRHLTRSDIGEVKGVHILDLKTSKVEFVSTPADVCQPFQSITIDEANFDGEIPLVDSSKIYVDIRGSRDFCRTICDELPPLVKKRSMYTDERQASLRESDGIPVAFDSYSRSFFSSNQVSPDMASDVLAKVYEACPSLKLGVT